ncbi:MAG: hypothetical protein KDK70_30335 [Myxococcales bacterium]|nr:hypothetical protein [Myxococcales bacterium]
MGGTGCEGKTDAGETDGTETSGVPIDTSAEGSGTNTNTTPGTSNSGTAESGSDATSVDGTADTTDTASSSGDTTTTTTTGDPNNPVDCGGTIWACGDGKDNDGDGFIDLNDPECTGPCDDDESSFQTGIPGDNMDCKQDCFFDGNSGQGDDGCVWDLRCDPENPGEFINCEYTGGNNCDNQPPNQDQGCIEFCEPFVPPGCDCFGCCEVHLDDGTSVWIFLNSHPDCALDNLAACTECSPQIDDCGNTCEPQECELCFGETELPPGCDETNCPDSMPCMEHADCANDYFCYLGCCVPPPPG